MSLSQFPVMPGVGWGISKTGVTSSRVLTAASGVEYRAQNWAYPRWKFTLPIEFMREYASFTEWSTLQGFILAMGGQFDNFIYSDPFDNTATTQPVGAGNGTEQNFPLVRTIGGYTEPIYYVNTVSAVYQNGVLVSSGDYTIIQTGPFGLDTIQFSTPPSNGVVITADFTFYFVCRFLTDETEFMNFLTNRWSAKAIEFESVK